MHGRGGRLDEIARIRDERKVYRQKIWHLSALLCVVESLARRRSRFCYAQAEVKQTERGPRGWLAGSGQRDAGIRRGALTLRAKVLRAQSR